jgi:ubiquinone/menaquinone biosynthesis C-methylase UbiE
MDLKDYEVGIVDTNFWFKAKNDLMNQLIGKKKKLRILDLGIGTGGSLKVLKKYGRVYATDINNKVLKLIPKWDYYEKKVCDARRITYPSNYFDLVILFDVLEHVKESKKVVSEIHRVLKKKGVLLLTVPAYQFLYSSHDKALEHIKRYSRRELYGLLQPFKIKKFGYWNSILFPFIAIVRLLKKWSKPSVDNVSKLPGVIDELLYKLLSFENYLIRKGVNLPFGLSLYAKCQKF